MKDRRGAVYVEFLIAFLPMFCMFMALIQLAFIEVANLVAKHAAFSACRAAIVVLPDDPKYYDNAAVYAPTGKRLSDIKAAATKPLRAVAVTPDVEVTFPTSPGGTDNKTQFAADDEVRVHVTFKYQCQIPIGRQLLCGIVDGKKKLDAEAAMPMQGATYDYDSK